MGITKRGSASVLLVALTAASGLPAAAQAVDDAASPRASGASYPLQPGTMPARPSHVPPGALKGAATPAKPAPSEAQKKADAQAQADKQKQELAAAMDRVTARWRERAQAQGWTAHPPTPVQPVAGIEASGRQASASGQPGGKLGDAAREAPVRSEKLGTAPASEDVKQAAPTEDIKPAQPAASDASR